MCDYWELDSDPSINRDNPHRNATKPASNGSGLRAYESLTEYAGERYVAAFEAAGWRIGRAYDPHKNAKRERTALIYPTKSGERYRFIDAVKGSKYGNAGGFQHCWYGLDRAVAIAREQEQPLVLCNGEASTITAQAEGVPAACITGGEGNIVTYLSQGLLAELQNAWQGAILVALDCDQAGRKAAGDVQAVLRSAGYDVRVVDLGGNGGFDLRDFTQLHQGGTMDALLGLGELKPVDAAGEPTGLRKSGAFHTQDWIEAIVERGYIIRRNEARQRIEINGEPISDLTRDMLWLRLNDEVAKISRDKCDALINMIAHDNRYHPIKEYLEAQQWDGTDWIATAARYLHAGNGAIRYPDGAVRSVAEAWLRRWLVGAVERIYSGRHNYVLTFVGGQGRGKSHFFRWLCALPEYHTERTADPDSKDDKLLKTQKWVWELSELDGITRKADVARLKSFLSDEVVSERPAYARYAEDRRAMVSFCASVNQSEFLSDSTGNRRYLTLDIEAIDWSYTSIPLDQLWAQAYALWQAGEPSRLLPCEDAVATAQNAGHEAGSTTKDMLLTVFEHNPASQSPMTAMQIVQAINAHYDPEMRRITIPASIHSYREIANALRSLWGINSQRRRVGTAQVTCYVGLSLRNSAVIFEPVQNTVQDVQDLANYPAQNGCLPNAKFVPVQDVQDNISKERKNSNSIGHSASDESDIGVLSNKKHPAYPAQGEFDAPNLALQSDKMPVQDDVNYPAHPAQQPPSEAAISYIERRIKHREVRDALILNGEAWGGQFVAALRSGDWQACRTMLQSFPIGRQRSVLLALVEKAVAL